MAGGRAANAVLRFPARAFRRGGTAARRGGTAARRQLNTAVGGPARVRAVVLLACVLALASADTATVGAAAAPLRHALGISNTDIGLLVTVTALVGAVFSLPFGVLADRARRTWVLGFALLTWGAAMLWSATSSSFSELLLTRVCLGAVTAAAGPIVASLVGDWFPASERGKIYGYILSGELLGAGAGFAFTGDIAALSWRLAFVILAIPALVLAWLIVRLPEPARGGQGWLVPEPSVSPPGAVPRQAAAQGPPGEADPDPTVPLPHRTPEGGMPPPGATQPPPGAQLPPTQPPPTQPPPSPQQEEPDAQR